MANLPVVIFQFATSPYQELAIAGLGGRAADHAVRAFLSIVARLISSMFGVRESRVE